MTACVSTFLAQAAHAAPPVPAGRPRVAVVEALNLPPEAAPFHAKARTTLERAVSERGLELVKTASEPAVCASDACLKEIATNSDTTEVLAVTGGPSDYRGYRVELQLWHAATAYAEHATAVCNFCDGQQMIAQILNGARPMLDHLARRTATAPVAPPAPVVLPPPAPAVSPVTRPPAVTMAVERPATEIPRAAIGLTIGGGLVAAVGVGLLVVDGRCSQSPCDPNVPHHVYDTEKIGLPLTIVGGLAALAGAGWWIYDATSAPKAIAFIVGPSGFSIAGRY